MRNPKLPGFRLLPVALCTVILAACGGGGGGGGSGGTTPSQDGPSVSGEMLVGVQPSLFGAATVETLITSVGQIVAQDAKGSFYRIALNSGISQDQAAAKLKSPYVLYVEKNYLAYGFGSPPAPAAPTDPGFALSYSTKVQNELQAGWAAYGALTPTTPVILAVLDTGVETTHDDLKNKLVDPSLFKNLVANPPSLLVADDNGHGTALAGIAAAEGNGTGTVGISSWDGTEDPKLVTILPVKVADQNNVSNHAAIAAGIHYAIASGANVILLSLGSVSPSYTLQTAIEDAYTAGVLVVAAAGNNGTPSARFPAAYQATNQRVLSVSSATPADALDTADTANYGPWVNLLAPGAGLTVPGIATDSTYLNSQNGSSLAAAHAAGAAAMLLSAYPPATVHGTHGTGTLTLDEVRSAVLAGLDSYDRPATTSVIAPSGGRLNLAKVVAAATAIQGAVDGPTATEFPGSVVFSATSIRGGSALSGTVVMTGEVKAATPVALTTTDGANITIAGSVTVPLGARSATFSVATKPVSTLTTVTVSATAHSVAASGSLDLTSPGVSQVTLSPNPVVGGATATGTVHLAGPAPTGGYTVTLSDDNSTSQTGSTLSSTSISIPAGATTGTFTVPTVAVAVKKTVRITATAVSGSAFADLPILPVLASVSFAPSSIKNGSTSVLTVKLNGAQTSDTSVTLTWTDASGALTSGSKPATVTVPKTKTSVTQTVTSTVSASDQTVKVNGAFGGTTTPDATLSVLTAKVSGVSFPAGPIVNWGDPSHDGHVTGTVTFDSMATAGTVVYLSSSDLIVAIPASVTVPGGGSTTVSFTLTPAVAVQDTVVTITASLAPDFSVAPKSANVTLKGALQSITLSPAQAAAGATITGTVKLNAAAPDDTTVALSSSNTSIATVPGTMKVLSGATSGTFTFSVGQVDATTAVSITASYQGVFKSATLTGKPPVIASVTFSPNFGYLGDSITGTVNLTAAAFADTTVALVSSNSTIVPGLTSVVVAKGTSSKTFTFTVGAVTTQTPVTVTATLDGATKTGSFTGKVMQVSSLTFSPTSGFPGDTVSGTVTLNAPALADSTVTVASGNTTIVPNPTLPVVVAKGFTTQSFTFTVGAVTAQTAVAVTAAFNGSSKAGTFTGKPVTVSSLAFSPTSGLPGTLVQGTVTLNNKVLADTTVTLSSSDTTIIPGTTSMKVLANATSGTFTFTVGAVAAQKVVTVTCTLNGATKTGTFTGIPVTVSSVTFNLTSAPKGQLVTGTVTLSATALADTTVALSSSDTTIVPGLTTMKVLQGATSGSFTFTVGTVAAQKAVTVTATLHGATKTGTFTGNLGLAPTLQSVTLDWPSGIADDKVTVTATLTSNALLNTDVTLVAGDTTIVPGLASKVTVSQGQTSASTTFTTGTVAAQKAVTITASAAGSSNQTVTFTGRPGYVAFLSSSSNNGSFGGLAGADAYCQGLALTGATHNIPQRRPYIAFMSDSTTNAIDRVVEGQYALSDGTMLATSKAGLASGSLTNNILTTDQGSPITSDVYTGSNADGTASADTCSDWADAGSSTKGAVGRADYFSNSVWLSAGKSDSCDTQAAVYCFEQPVQNKVVFVTSLAHQHDGKFTGLTGADAYCQARAGAATAPGFPQGKTWVAFLSSSTVDAKDRISDGQYVLSNGTVIAANKAELLSGTLRHAIGLDELGSTSSDLAVRTGSTAGGLKSGGNCADWTDNGSLDSIYGDSTASNSFWADYGSITCGNLESLYCFQK